MHIIVLHKTSPVRNYLSRSILYSILIDSFFFYIQLLQYLYHYNIYTIYCILKQLYYIATYTKYT